MIKPIDREAIYWEHEGNRVVYLGKWKLISKASKKRSLMCDKVDELPIEYWELFDMEKDRTEMFDVSQQNFDLVNKMAAMWQEWSRRTIIVPRPEK
ncbi:MAG: hypothetical protein IPL46_28235 [Saprospiraceae bacterium]|nr:hypothetical protein [Saprospiraceae bacterium]